MSLFLQKVFKFWRKFLNLLRLQNQIEWISAAKGRTRTLILIQECHSWIKFNLHKFHNRLHRDSCNQREWAKRDPFSSWLPMRIFHKTKIQQTRENSWKRCQILGWVLAQKWSKLMRKLQRRSSANWQIYHWPKCKDLQKFHRFFIRPQGQRQKWSSKISNARVLPFRLLKMVLKTFGERAQEKSNLVLLKQDRFRKALTKDRQKRLKPRECWVDNLVRLKQKVLVKSPKTRHFHHFWTRIKIRSNQKESSKIHQFLLQLWHQFQKLKDRIKRATKKMFRRTLNLLSKIWEISGLNLHHYKKIVRNLNHFRDQHLVKKLALQALLSQQSQSKMMKFRKTDIRWIITRLLEHRKIPHSPTLKINNSFQISPNPGKEDLAVWQNEQGKILKLKISKTRQNNSIEI